MTLLDMLGPTAIPTLICFAVGLVLLVIEMFTPGFGVSGATGLLCVAAAVIMQFAWGDTRVALYLLAIVLLLIVLALVWFIRSFQRGKLSRSFLVLDDKIDGASTPEIADAKLELIGKTGVSLTPLRPAGIAEIGGCRYDVMTAGAFLEKDEKIQVVNAEGMHILVRKADAGEAASSAPEANGHEVL